MDDVGLNQPGEQRAEDQRHHRAWQPARPSLRPGFDNQERDDRQSDGRPLDRVEVSDEYFDLTHEFRRHRFVEAQSEEILDLRAQNEHGDTAGESYSNRIANELDHA